VEERATNDSGSSVTRHFCQALIRSRRARRVSRHGYIKGPAYFNTDLSLFKNFHVTERQTLQFRIQAFNFINHDLPDLTQGNALNLNFNQNGVNTNTCASTTSGSCTDGRAHYTTGRRVLELALKYNF
jgi:hypothetical protein